MKGIVDGRRFHAGTFIIIDRTIGQYMLHDGSEVKLARTISRMPGAEEWSKEALVKVGCTPYDIRQPRRRWIIRSSSSLWPGSST